MDLQEIAVYEIDIPENVGVEILDIVPHEYGYTVIAPGFGFLRDIYTEPYLVNWRLSRTHAESDAMPGNFNSPCNGLSETQSNVP